VVVALAEQAELAQAEAQVLVQVLQAHLLLIL
jgi:hypothetical protein